MFQYEWVVRVTTDHKISEDAVSVIDDLKKDFADAVLEVLDIDDEFSGSEPTDEVTFNKW